MTTIWTYVLLVVGFVLLIKGADFFVEGSSGIAKKLKVPSLIIGLTIVAMGTSLPECAVCGFCAVITPLAVGKRTLKQEFPFSVLMAALLLVLGYIGMSVGRIDGVILLIFFALFMFWMVHSALKARTAGIAFGGDMVVDSASAIAAAFGLSQNLIGLTIVAMGTSLPELVTSIVAARKNEVDMALGNVIGSNIFNILFVLGIAAAISPVAFIMENVIDIVILIAMSIMVLLFAWSRQKINRIEGAIMLLSYAGYMVYICMR